jgi:predicted CopG family antitoxin
METKTIKISAENYRWLARLAAALQKEEREPVSFDKAVTEIKTKISARDALLAMAGIWKMSSKEADNY